MAAITASMVKDLREKTGAGMMDAKKALVETDGDAEAAVDWLRTKGLAKAAKKAGRTAADGLVAFATEGTKGSLVEVNAETDFVARNETFQKMVRAVADLAVETEADTESLKAATFPGTSKTVEAHITEMVGQIGENMALRRAATIRVGQGVVAPYVHTPVADRAGKIGVLVALESTGDQEALQALGRKVALHVAAARPQSLDIDGLDPALIEREKSVLADQARASGKPEQIIDKMVEGRMRKFYEESVLLEQVFMGGENPDGLSVRKMVEQAKGEVGAEVKLTAFLRFELGEGIEKQDDDFAAEVASLSKG
jgi:elongation factor Ts